MEENKETLENVRIIDYDSNVTAMNKLQGLKPYYTFKSADIVSYDVDGEPTAVAIGARELDPEKLAKETSDSYVNKTYKYTHGYGVAVQSYERGDAGGAAEVYRARYSGGIRRGNGRRDAPLDLLWRFTTIVIVNTKLKEIDYSEGQTNVEFSYDGTGGINLGWLNRALFSVMYGDYKMLVSNQITADSKILPNRNILERVKKVAPFSSMMKTHICS